MTPNDLRALRKRLGMTQVQLAEALDITAGTVANYEGARGPYEIPRVVELACEALYRRFERWSHTYTRVSPSDDEEFER
jgi:transcriptional regulator with XRE-family HTH domain